MVFCSEWGSAQHRLTDIKGEHSARNKNVFDVNVIGILQLNLEEYFYKESHK